jgi:hypothetical protein
MVADVVQQQRSGLDQGVTVFEDGFELGDERVLDLQGLHRPQCRFGQQRSGGRDRVDGVGLGQPAGPPLGGGALGGDFSGVEPGGDQGDRDVRAPGREVFNADLDDTVRGQQVDRVDEAVGGVREGGVGEFDAVVSTILMVNWAWCGSMPATGAVMLWSPAGS